MSETALWALPLVAGSAEAKLFSSGAVSTLFFLLQPANSSGPAAIVIRTQLVIFILFIPFWFETIIEGFQFSHTHRTDNPSLTGRRQAGIGSLQPLKIAAMLRAIFGED